MAQWLRVLAANTEDLSLILYAPHDANNYSYHFPLTSAQGQGYMCPHTLTHKVNIKLL